MQFQCNLFCLVKSFLFYCFVHIFLSKPCLFSKVIKDATQAYVLNLCSFLVLFEQEKKAEEAAALSCISEIASQSLLVDLQNALKHRFERKMKSLLLQVLLVSYFSLFGFLPLSTRRVSSIHNVTVKPSRFSLNLRVEDVLYTLVHNYIRASSIEILPFQKSSWLKARRKDTFRQQQASSLNHSLISGAYHVVSSEAQSNTFRGNNSLTNHGKMTV